jgi:phosphatidylserine decarboxylase
LRFAREGYVPAAVPAVIGLLLGPLVGWAIGAPLLVLGTLVLLFFRDPDRRPPADERALVAPADGRVVSVERVTGGHELDAGVRQRIAIFMSPLDVHVNRVPAAGEVERIRHRDGRFKAAYSTDAAEVNESNAMAVRLADGSRMIVVQIAGWLARRIVCHVREGDVLSRGERFGLIMFGSRVDVYVDEDISISVEPDQRVVAGVTVIGQMPSGRAGAARGQEK